MGLRCWKVKPEKDNLCKPKGLDKSKPFGFIS